MQKITSNNIIQNEKIENKSSTKLNLMKRAILATTILCSGMSAPALAQNADAPEQYRNADGNGVDLGTGSLNIRFEEGSLGDISMVRHFGQSGWRDNWSGDLRKTSSGGNTYITITFGGTSERFKLVGGNYVADQGNGATLVSSGAAGNYTYTASDGTVIEYKPPFYFDQPGSTYTIAADDSHCSDTNAVECGLPSEITRPNGKQYTLTWDGAEQCSYGDGGTGGPVLPGTGGDPFDGSSDTECTVTYRLGRVHSNSGYAMIISYESDQSSTNGGSGLPPTGWFIRDGLTFLDTSQAICPEIGTCDTSGSNWPRVTYSNPSANIQQVENSDGLIWQFTVNSTQITTYNSPVSNNTITYDANGKVASVNRDGEITTYGMVETPTETTTTVTDPGSDVTTIVSEPGSDPDAKRPVTITNPVNDTVNNEYDSQLRLIKTTMPEGNYVSYTRDARGNVTSERHVAKPGSGDADIVYLSSFAASCTNPLTCNKPVWTRDAKGNQTDYTYNATTGELIRVRLPAPASGQPRPEINYVYTPLYARIKDSGGNMVDADTPIYKLTEVRSCSTAATCTGNADETVVTIEYGSGSGPNNLLPTKVTTAAGDGSVSSSVTTTYDDLDNVKTVDCPLTGDGDKIMYFYDSENRQIGSIGGDPDGAGTMLRPASRVFYDSEGRAYKTQSGTATAQTEAAFNAMTVHEEAEVDFNAQSRVSKQTYITGGTTESVIQFSYDSKGRLECTAQRMNPALFTSLPGSACTLGTAGSFGADRIAKNIYDDADRVVTVQTALGTPAQTDEVTAAYTSNGRTASVIDGEGNRTSYGYDGHDRQRTTYYPHKTSAGTSSTTDYEQLTYDASGNVTSLRLRDGQSIGLTYDRLNRLTNKNLPGSEPDASYSYDLAGKMLTASQDGQTLTFAYDGLGRNTSVTGPLGSTSYQYDTAGRRTRMTWDDGFYVTYAYKANGQLQSIKENGSASIAAYTYDTRSRGTTVTYGNGTSTDIAYDAASRLASLTQNLSGTVKDNTTTFQYNTAGQITELTRSNDAYAWTEHTSKDVTDTHNGLNQITGSGGAGGFTYDTRGNLTSDGSSSYTYSSENFLKTGPGGMTLSYDPLGRLYQVTGGATNERLAYDGMDLIAEYDTAGNILRRYVHGPGTDDPILWYEGSSTTDKRYMHKDERGSIVAVTDGTGAAIATNSYNEYGMPAPTNYGRFQYTGQTWISDLGLYYYKARFYDADLGRFLQTDPIGYGDGMNMYGYVGGDPVNYRDPTGKSRIRDHEEEKERERRKREARDWVDENLPNASKGQKSKVRSAIEAYLGYKVGLGDVKNIVTGVGFDLNLSYKDDMTFEERRSLSGKNVEATKWDMIRSCAGKKQGTDSCIDSKNKYFEAYNRHNDLTRLPYPAGEFETIKPPLLKTGIGVGGCISYIASGLMSYGGGFFVNVVGAASCGSAADDISKTVYPEQRRK